MRPWALDITPDNAGNPPFLFGVFIDPYAPALAKPMEWRTDDWDPALRFWALKSYDPNLTEWLKVVDASRPSIMAAREFGAQMPLWGRDTAFLEAAPNPWIEPADLLWRPASAAAVTAAAAGPGTPAQVAAAVAAAITAASPAATGFIQAEIVQLQQLMQDDRDRYLAEIEAQADGLAAYVIAFIGADQVRHPWTIELIDCALAIGNVAYMRWKSLYRRVRPSFLCPALAPSFGPPQHPAFPSGHSTLGHLIALLLLEIPGLLNRFGKKGPHPVTGVVTTGLPVTRADLTGTGPINSPLLWLAARLAQNRERLGVHYPSDSSAGRHLAAALWDALLNPIGAPAIDCPTLQTVLARAKAEWPV